MDCKTVPATGPVKPPPLLPAWRGQVHPHICPRLPANLLMEGGGWLVAMTLKG